ncbi:unnamed protein product [Prorocentrum cordatum]|uniref:RNA-directed RNA polymerase n=1 Tax=Prorocentrum cordatum TaxID=2364126 RepID=A0ABN9Y7A2_9DINO|nr:unnamed protein product [Polarella glacialis]
MAAEDDRPAKLRRLSRLRAELPFMHCNAMAQFLASVKRDGIPELGSRRQDIRDARELMVGENTPCGKLHQNMIVGQHTVEICSPAAMRWYCSALPAMQPLWQRALELPRPWHISIYGDEIGAGNALAHVQNRKSWGIYWAIAEFGPQDAWFQLATMRAKTANDIQPRGLTMLLDAILAQFWPDQGRNFSAGISLRLRPDGATELIQMDLVRDIVASDATGVAVHHSEPDASRLQPMTAPLLDAICNRLIEGVNIMNKGEFQELERRLGWNWDPHLPERVRKLKPLETVMFDWMHCIFVNGTYNILVFQMFRRLKGYWARADAYFQDWSFPGRHSISPDTCAIFGEKRARRQADADKLQAAVNRFLPSYSSAFGKETMAQKFHYLRHFANYVRRRGHVALPSCGVLERKHKTSKRFANALQAGAAASSGWGANVLKSVTERHLWQLMDGDTFKVNCLVNATRPSKAISRELLQQFGPADFVTSAAARRRYHVVKYGDVALLEDGGGERIAAEVLKHLSFTKNGHYYGLSLVLPYFFKEKLHPRASAHALGGDADAFWARTASIACSLAWAPREGGGVRAARPIWSQPRWCALA